MPISPLESGPDSLQFWMGRYQELAVRGLRSEAVERKIRLHLGRFLDFFQARYGHDRLSAWVRRDTLAWREALSGQLAAATVNNHAREFRIFTNVHSALVDPKKFDERSFVEYQGDSCISPPNSFALARSVEYFRIPRNVLTICVGKSTYARCGIITNVTPFEPEWEGFVTLEISNTTPLPARIYANEGIAQVLFFEADPDDECEVSYKDKKGKYQAQQGVTLPKI